ncbi:ATP-binding protein [Krasilnikovia sp. MM14-A1004]|uniref:HAMP domain-containing sensor histidine kinase n=1 Tax=Krasilnikovia sp. MM14-A1004 TaxID=3373541 RepID=UPI00399CBF16
MLVTVLVLVVGLGIGGAALVAALNVALLRAANTEALDTANAVARLVDEGSLSDPIPAPPGVQVQVVDAQDRVTAVSVGTDRLVPILYPDEMGALPDRAGRYLPGERIGLPGRVRVVAVAAGPAHDRVRVLVARSTADLSQGVHVLRVLLLVAFPLLVGLLALVAWRLAGATLRPVEALRAGAERITGAPAGRGADPPQRLPVPDTGDEIHRLAVTLNDMLERLGAARARQRAFVADAAHELRSPLTNMRTELEVAQRLPDGTDWPALADDLLTDVERLSRLVDDLLLLARSDDAATPAAPVGEVELGELLASVAGRYPTVRFTPPAEPLDIPGDPDALARVVANLLDNAVRHAASTVELTTGADGTYRSITVTDDGPGIPAADRERVFDRFTRLDDARARDAGGTGLGLAIVRELVRRHGGTVTLADAGPGLRVTVRLPGRGAAGS